MFQATREISGEIKKRKSPQRIGSLVKEVFGQFAKDLIYEEKVEMQWTCMLRKLGKIH